MTYQFSNNVFGVNQLTQVFFTQNLAVTSTDNTSDIQIWQKPKGVKLVTITCIGGGGGGSYSSNGGFTGYGGNGGGGGSISNAIFLAQTIPDSLYIKVGRGGIGGIASSQTNATSGGSTIVSISPINPTSDSNILIHAEGGPLATIAGIGGSTSNNNYSNLITLGIYVKSPGGVGATGRLTTPGDPGGFGRNTGGGYYTNVFGGAGGGGNNGGVTTSGGSQFYTGFYDDTIWLFSNNRDLYGGSAGGTQGGAGASPSLSTNMFSLDNMDVGNSYFRLLMLGGAGGGGGTTTGGRGGNGVFGGGGGGGGAGSTITSNGNGGNGGPGFVIISCSY